MKVCKLHFVEFSIFQQTNGLYYFSIFSSEGGRIMVCSLENAGTKYVIKGLDEMARDYVIELSLSGDRIYFDGVEFERAMME